MNTATSDFNYRFNLTNYAMFDRNRQRKVAIYGRVSTEHEAQLSALENQLQWYDDQFRYHPNWNVYDRYIDEGITGTQAKKRPAFLKMVEDAKCGKFDLIVTREVCRFARNVVDTLVVTRELKAIGVEVFFIDDNIWTMDGDGELRLSLMATLAQEESRKTSERVKAGQKISRDNGVLYGNGNILGYDRVGDNYIINEEQAETVRMIFELYLQGLGSLKICEILTERKRKTASNVVRWSLSNVTRVIKNATYTGKICYNKSRSNNFLEQKRVNNLDMDTYEYVNGNFPAIVTQEIWEKAQEIRKARVKPAMVTANRITYSNRDSKDVWLNKMRCTCGSSFFKMKWHTNKDGRKVFGYQCYNRRNNGDKKTRAELGLDTEGYCDGVMIPDWKLELMAKKLFESIWVERLEAVELAIQLIKTYYKNDYSHGKQQERSAGELKLKKAKTRLDNLIAMRADGEVTKDEYLSLRASIEKEIDEIQNQLQPEENNTIGLVRELDLDGISAELHKMIDTDAPMLDHSIISQFVYKITPTSARSFEWYLNLNGRSHIRAKLTALGHKKNCTISIEEIEKISSLHRGSQADLIFILLNTPSIISQLHRQH